jgi:hypothetical protein
VLLVSVALMSFPLLKVCGKMGIFPELFLLSKEDLMII